MKRMIWSIALASMLVGGFVYAEDKALKAQKAPATAPSTQPVNSMCIIDKDHAIDDRETVLYEGKLIGFCCEDCKALFNKDPKKYVADMK